MSHFFDDFELELGDEVEIDDEMEAADSDDDYEEEEEEGDEEYLSIQQTIESAERTNSEPARLYAGNLNLTDNAQRPVFNIVSEEMNDPDESSDIQMIPARGMSANQQPSTSSTASRLPTLPVTLAVKEEARKGDALNESSSSEAGTCTICYDPFTTSAQHRVVCLKCGHLYGKACIEKWISSNGNKARCPECNAPIKKVDIRIIYSHTVRALDTSERDQALTQLENVKEQNVRLKEQVEELKMTVGLKESELYLLKKELNDKETIIESLKGNRIANSLLSVKNQSLERKREPFKFVDRVHIQPGGARLIATSEILGYIFVTHQSPNHLYKGYGLRRLHICNLKRFDFIYLHDKMIRDLAVHPKDALILTAATDRSIKLTNLLTSTVMFNVSLEVDPWCVCWDANNHDRFYAGLNNGKVYAFCSRSGSKLREFNTPIKSPIISLESFNTEQSNRAGLLITGMNTSFYGQINSNMQTPEACAHAELAVSSLNVEGRFMSTHVMESRHSGLILLSCRPGAKNANVHHFVSMLVKFFKLVN